MSCAHSSWVGRHGADSCSSTARVRVHAAVLEVLAVVAVLSGLRVIVRVFSPDGRISALAPWWPLLAVAVGALLYASPLPLFQPLDLSEPVRIRQSLGLGLTLLLVSVGMRSHISLGVLLRRVPRLLLAVLIVAAATAVAAGWALELGGPLALLVGAALAAGDPSSGELPNVRAPARARGPAVERDPDRGKVNEAWTLALAGAVVLAAVASASARFQPDVWVVGDVAMRTGLAMALGSIIGWSGSRLLNGAESQRVTDALIVWGVGLLAYGCTVLVGGYGLVAVLVSGHMVGSRLGDRRAGHMQRFTAALDWVASAWLLVSLGAILAAGALVGASPLTLFIASLLALARPLLAAGASKALSLEVARGGIFTPPSVAGVGGLYLFAWGLTEAVFPDPATAWAVVAAAILISLIITAASNTAGSRLLRGTT